MTKVSDCRAYRCLGWRLNRGWALAAVLTAVPLVAGCIHTRSVAPALAASLAPETSFEGYAVRPPSGMTLKQRSSNTPKSTRNFYEWVSPDRPDGSKEVFQVEILRARPGFVTDDSRLLLRDYSAGNARHHTEYVTSAITPATINDVPFVRCDWSGFFPPTHNRNHGLFYVTTDGQTVVYISGNDAEPYNRADMPVFEAAASTFRKL